MQLQRKRICYYLECIKNLFSLSPWPIIVFKASTVHGLTTYAAIFFQTLTSARNQSTIVIIYASMHLVAIDVGAERDLTYKSTGKCVQVIKFIGRPRTRTSNSTRKYAIERSKFFNSKLFAYCIIFLAVHVYCSLSWFGSFRCMQCN
jgi:hypothetical protein